MKICTKCKKEKPFSEFTSRGGQLKHLLKSRCKTCMKDQHKKWVSNNTDKVRVYRAKDPWTLKKRCKRHNISVEEFWAIYEEQDGSCPVCNKAIEAENSAIDHNHKTGEVRGVLCKSCNRALGLLGDNPNNLFRGSEYLRKKGFYG